MKEKNKYARNCILEIMNNLTRLNTKRLVRKLSCIFD